MKKKDPSPSPMGHRSRRVSREPLDRSGRTSEDRGRASEDHYRPAEYVPSPLSATPDKPIHKLEKKLSNLGRVFDREKDEEDAEEREQKRTLRLEEWRRVAQARRYQQYVRAIPMKSSSHRSKSNIELLHNTCRTFLENVLNATGFVGTLLLGGTMPETGNNSTFL